MRREKLVNVELGPGRFVKMYESDAAKIRKAPENKMQRPAENKAATDDDFTEIDGIGPATAEDLRSRGYRTFADLRDADLDDLPWRARATIEEWRNA